MTVYLLQLYFNLLDLPIALLCSRGRRFFLLSAEGVRDNLGQVFLLFKICFGSFFLVRFQPLVQPVPVGGQKRGATACE